MNIGLDEAPSVDTSHKRGFPVLYSLCVYLSISARLPSKPGDSLLQPLTNRSDPIDMVSEYPGPSEGPTKLDFARCPDDASRVYASQLWRGQMVVAIMVKVESVLHSR